MVKKIFFYTLVVVPLVTLRSCACSNNAAKTMVDRFVKQTDSLFPDEDIPDLDLEGCGARTLTIEEALAFDLWKLLRNYRSYINNPSKNTGDLISYIDSLDEEGRFQSLLVHNFLVANEKDLLFVYKPDKYIRLYVKRKCMGNVLVGEILK